MKGPVPIPTTVPGLIGYFPIADAAWVGVHLFALAVPLVFLFTGWGARLRTYCLMRAGGNQSLGLMLFAAVYLALAGLIVLPSAYYLDIALPAAWNGPVPALPTWLGGKLALLGGEIALGAPLLLIAYKFIARAPRFWWLYLTVIGVPCVLGGLLLYQLVIQPTLAGYHPLEDPALAAEIDSLAARCGLSHVYVLVGGTSDDSVVGIGPWLARMVISKQSIHTLPPAEMTAAVAHELKHYLFDGWKVMAVAFGLALSGLLLVARVGPWAIRKFQTRFGFSDLADPASLPLIMFIVMSGWFFVGLPVFNTIQRHIEHNADRFALEITHDNRGQALLRSRNAQYFLNDEPLFDKLWRYNHPSLAERVRFADTYRPWAEGKPLVYGKDCRMP